MRGTIPGAFMERMTAAVEAARDDAGRDQNIAERAEKWPVRWRMLFIFSAAIIAWIIPIAIAILLY